MSTNCLQRQGSGGQRGGLVAAPSGRLLRPAGSARRRIRMTGEQVEFGPDGVGVHQIRGGMVEPEELKGLVDVFACRIDQAGGGQYPGPVQR